MLRLSADFFIFWASYSNHCLAALDLGAGVEQPFHCLIVQNRRAVQSMRRSMDWTLEDNVVNGLFFCATLKGRRGGHNPFVQIRAKHLTPVQRRLRRTYAVLGGVIPGGCRCWGWKCGVLWGFLPIPNIRPVRRTYIVLRKTDVFLCVGYRWEFRFEAPCICTHWMGEHKLSNLDSFVDGKVVGGGRTQASSHNSQGVVDGGVERSVWALRHQKGAQYSAVERTKARVAVRKVVAPAPQPDLSRARNRRARFVVEVDFKSSRSASLLLRWMAADTIFVVLSFSFKVWRYSSMVVVSLLSTLSTACQSPSAMHGC